MPSANTLKYTLRMGRATSSTTAREKRLQRDMLAAAVSTKMVIPAASFKRVVDELVQGHVTNMRIRGDAIQVLHHIGEDVITDMFKDANRAAHHAGRGTVTMEDIRLSDGETLVHEEVLSPPCIAMDQDESSAL